jgi:inner membrane protein
VPSPIAHVAAGYAVLHGLTNLAGATARSRRDRWTAIAGASVLSLLPDLDAVPGFLAGDIGRYHNNLSHSILLGGGAALGVGLTLKALRNRRALFWAVVTLACWELHILMDWLTVGRGVMALWPWAPDRFRSPVLIFPGLHWSDGLWTTRHLWTALNDGAFAAAVVAAVHWRRPRAANPG